MYVDKVKQYEASLRQVPVAARSAGTADACALQALQLSCGDCGQSFDPQIQLRSRLCMHRDNVEDKNLQRLVSVMVPFHSFCALTCSVVISLQASSLKKYLQAVWNT